MLPVNKVGHAADLGCMLT